MSKKRTIQEILPWTNGELEKLLRELIAHGTEAAKVDFKVEIEIGTPEQKAELLKDITAIANTYDESYNDHGFLIYGVKAKALTGVVSTETDTDKLQNTIEQLLKTYISPMPQIYVIGFQNTTGEKWGAIVIPARNSKPHMFFKELSCPTNQTKSRKRGEWFVRRGATTDPGLPEDLTLIMQRQTELLLEPLRESVRSLQTRVAKTEDQYNSALFKLVERAVAGIPASAGQTPDVQEQINSATSDIAGLDLPTRLKQRLRTPVDSISEDLIAETKTLREYLDGADTGLPWTPQAGAPDASKKIIEDIEEKTRPLMLSIATIVLKDQKGAYTDALLRALKLLARTTEVPTGTSYNRVGEALRYYPLGIILYTIFICGVAANRGDLLKQVMDIPLKFRARNATTHITDVFFLWYEAKAFFNHAYAQRWCEPTCQRIRQIIGDSIGSMITDLSEPEFFFRGEFVLALTHIDVCMTNGEPVDNRVPAPGLYLYMHEAHSPIAEFLLEHPAWLDKLHAHPLNEILDMFDRNAHKMAGSGCIPIGLTSLKTRELYDESIRRKAKK